jgi:ribonuclease BN (tRNA processing enzyme)
MLIRCYGARGSIPVSGREYCKYGGDTTCLEIRSKNDAIIVVDAGSGIRRLGNRLVNEERYRFYLLFTHSHWDHILGFPFFKPIYDERTRITLMGCPTTHGDSKKLLAHSMKGPFFPIPFEKLRCKISYVEQCQESFDIDTIQVSAITLSHPNLGSGYRFVEDGKTFVFLTDNELGYIHRGGRTFDEYVAFSKNADLLVHDSEYTPEQYQMTKTWGHSTYVDALELAMKARVKAFGLFHHNQDRSDRDQDDIVNECREILALKKIDMACFGLRQTTEIEI